MKILDLKDQPAEIRQQAAQLLVDAFAQPKGWSNLEDALLEVHTLIEDGFAWVGLEEELVLGWIGGLPEYDGRVWELHPLVVRQGFRRRGIGRALVAAFEQEATRRGALTFTLGTDDDSGLTSLAGVDLFLDIPGSILTLHDLGKEHPFLFYRALGYVVTGVMPNANGVGYPDIYMSKASPLAQSAISPEVKP